jgi:hypothetical protein
MLEISACLWHTYIQDNAARVDIGKIGRIALIAAFAAVIIAVASNQSTQERLTRIQQLEMVFAEAGLTVVKPTAIYAPLQFKETQAGYTTDSDFGQSKAAVQAFIERFMPANRQVFEWEDGNSINFGALVEVDGIVENHYVSN